MDKRTLLAVSLCIGIFLLWYLVFVPALGLAPKPPPPKKASKAAPSAEAPAAPPEARPTPPAVQPAAQPQDYPDREPIPFDAGRYKGEFTVRGGGIRSLTLRFPDDKGEVPILKPLDTKVPHFALRQERGPLALDTLPWKLNEHKPNESVEFLYLLKHNGVQITKKFMLDPSNRHALRMEIRLENKNNPAEGQKEPPEQEMELDFLAFNGLVPDGNYRHDQYHAGVVGLRKEPSLRTIADVEKGERKLAEAAKIKEGKDRDAAVRSAEEYFRVGGADRDWMGLKNRFFAALLAPASDSAKSLVEAYVFRSASPEVVANGDKLKNLVAIARTGKIRVGAAPVSMEFVAYLGPIQSGALREAPPGAGVLLNYATGCTSGCGPLGVLFLPIAAIVQLVAPFILSILNFLGHSVFGNYGVGIIITTLLIRLCLFPLSKKSQEAAFKMQKLAPEIEVLRKRYGDDRQKFGMEQWKLFREHKIHPASGCLPMFLQLPIFVGMYSVFELSVELRRAPFMLWITDLSQPDAVIRFNPPISLLIMTVESLNILPIIMMITWFLQSWYAPRSPDPQMQTQQKMMLAMPVVFGLMCYNLASGLSLYFMVNSLLGMAEQKIIKKYILKIPAGPSRP